MGNNKGGDVFRKSETFRSRRDGGNRLKSFHPGHRVTSPTNIANQEEGKLGKKPVLALWVIITISSNGGTHGCGTSHSTRMTKILGRIITAVPIMSGISEEMPWVI